MIILENRLFFSILMTHEFFVVNSNMRKITKCFWLELWLLQLHTYRDLLSVHDRKFLHNQENKVITKKIYVL